MDIESEIMSKSELAKLLGVNKNTLDAWHRQGKAPPVHKVSSRKPFYLKSEVLEWLKQK